MAKLLIFPTQKREESQAEAQKYWLKENDIPVVQKIAWPQRTWFQARLNWVRAVRKMHGWS